MGEPAFRLREIIFKHGIRVFSSNYALYGDMSRRVNEVINQFSPSVEVYSIDETFLDMSRLGSVVLERIVTELRGVPCLALEVVPPARQGLAVTRSFGRPVSDPAEALEAIAAHATRAGEKLRQHGLVAGRITAFVHTSPHRPGPHRYGARSTRLVPMGADTRELVAAASRCLKAAWRDGHSYVKAGVFLDDLREPADAPPALLAAPRPGSDALMRAVDGLNARYGRNTVFPAAMGVERGWKQRAEHRSPRYTTRLADVLAVSAKG